MLDYGQTADESPGARSAPQGAMRPYLAAFSTAAGLFARNLALILAVAAACAIAGFGLSKVLTPRYVATAQIYIDPHGLPGVDKEGTPQGEDSNGFINFVESQSLVITSRIVLERVVASEKLDRDDEFVGAPSVWSHFFARTSQDAKSADDNVNAAVGALASKITVHRPERTFVIDLSVRSRDPEKAARLANAVATAFIEVQSSMRSDSARQTTASLTTRLEALRAQLMAAEKRVEDFRAQNGLVGTREQTVAEQQLKDMNQQITLARTRVEEARAHYDQIQAARNRSGDVGSIAVSLNLPSLSLLRAQQAEARQKLADLSGELGPRHPLVKDAAARVSEADRAVDAELARFAQSIRGDYARAKDLEASLSRQLDGLKQQSLANDQTSVGLRDLQREADAARNVYELFVTRSRQTGDIQQVDANAPNMRIISLASAPKDRAFPPSASLLGGAGFVLGLGAGFALAALRERRYAEPSMAARPADSEAEQSQPAETPRPAPAPKRKFTPPIPFIGLGRSRPAPAKAPPLIAITAHTWLECRERGQSIAAIDLASLGFATLQPDSDDAEFRGVFDAFGLFEQLKKPGGRRCVAVAGANESGLRSALAINLALTAAASGFGVALIDAASRNAKLTRAVREATHSQAIMRGVFFETINNILLALPKGYDESLGRMRPAEILGYLCDTADENIDVVICDGPDAADIDAELILGKADDLILIDAHSAPFDGAARLTALGAAAAKLRATVRFDEVSQPRRKSG
jgi:uncharacterized protein involved in exopolysaccharide biosynthesis